MISAPRLLALPLAFYLQPTVFVARALLGQRLLRRLPGEIREGYIVETEAYPPGDPALSALIKEADFGKALWGPPGQVYVHVNYGQHYGLNIVTEPAGIAASVLLRAIAPDLPGPLGTGPVTPRLRHRSVASGPSKLTRQFAVDRGFEHQSLLDATGSLWIAEGKEIPDEEVVVTTRIGFRRGAERPWRFYVSGSPYVSKLIRSVKKT